MNNSPIPVTNSIQIQFWLTIKDNQKFNFSPTSKDELLKSIKDINPEKAAGTNNLCRRFLKDGAVFLALSITKLCNLSMKRSKFPLEF